MTTTTLLSFTNSLSKRSLDISTNLQTFGMYQIIEEQSTDSNFDKWLNIVQRLTVIATKQTAVLKQQKFNNLNKPHQSLKDCTFEQNALIQSIKQYAFNHLEETNLSVTKISRAIGLSRTQLHRKVKALTNLSTTQFINFIRIDVARNLLLTTNNTISEIAYETGFQSLAYFSRVFRKLMHCSPSHYRKIGKALLMQQ